MSHLKNYHHIYRSWAQCVGSRRKSDTFKVLRHARPSGFLPSPPPPPPRPRFSEFDHTADRAQHGGAGDGPPPHGRRLLPLSRGVQLRFFSLLHAGDGTQGELVCLRYFTCTCPLIVFVGGGQKSRFSTAVVLVHTYGTWYPFWALLSVFVKCGDRKPAVFFAGNYYCWYQGRLCQNTPESAALPHHFLFSFFFSFVFVGTSESATSSTKCVISQLC